MRLSTILFGLVFMCAAIGVAVPLQDGDDVRGAFLTSRPKDKPATSSSTARPPRKRPRPSATPAKSPEKANPGSTGSTGSKGSTGSTARLRRPIRVPSTFRVSVSV